jgi:hypothetical protein
MILLSSWDIVFCYDAKNINRRCASFESSVNIIFSAEKSVKLNNGIQPQLF